MRLVAILACATMLVCGGDLPCRADKRVALVVGNGDYQHADKLANPLPDARRMREALERLGFGLVYGENLGKHELERTIGRFANSAQESDVALVYFAGHGATFGDVPYVVPVDAQFSSLGEMPYELVQVETLIGELRRAKGIRIAILDACRDNAAERELKRKSSRGGEITRGLVRPKNVDGLILAYATQYMSIAADGDASGHSPFTKALLTNILTPGLDVRELFFKVGREVYAATKGEQRPEISVSFYDSYALVPAGTVAPVSAPVGPPEQDQAGQVWAVIQNSTSQAVIEDFIRQFGATLYGSLARARLDELKRSSAAVVAVPPQPAAPSRPQDPAAQAWGTIQNTTSQAVLEDFIRQFGATPFGSMARARLEELKRKNTVATVTPAVTGTAAEAKAMLEKGVAALKANEADALGKFPKADGGFRDRDLYIYCFNTADGKFIAHVNPALVGTDIRVLKDGKDGSPLGQRIFDSAKEGSFATVAYNFPKPGTTEAVPKEAFVTKVGGQGCGVGYYK
jgi:uncharacterized caspase-like protein